MSEPLSLSDSLCPVAPLLGLHRLPAFHVVPFSPLLSSLYLVAEGVQERGDAGDVVIATGEGATEHGHHADGVAVGGSADGGGRGGLGGLEDEGARGDGDDAAVDL